MHGIAKAELPEGWIERKSSSRPGRVYFYNTNTGESVWERPAPELRENPRDKKQHTDKKKKMMEERVHCSHILVKHRGSRNPSSWKEKEVTRSKEEALKMIKGMREDIVEGLVSFEELAKTESHCSSAKRGGYLSEFGRGEMQKAFEDVAFSLKVGELSEPVETASGVHLILRTGWNTKIEDLQHTQTERLYL